MKMRVRRDGLMRCGVAAGVLCGAMLIGYYEVGEVKLLAAFLCPMVLYVTVANVGKLSWGNALPSLLPGIAGVLQIMVYNQFHEVVIWLLCVAAGLSCTGVFMAYRQCRSILACIGLSVASLFVLPFTLLGYNPYAAMEVNEVVSLSSMRKGLYQFQQYGSLGLRDRYGIVVYANYDLIELLSTERNARDYVVLYKFARDWEDYAIEDIYDLKNRRFVLPDRPDGYYSTERINDNTYAICDREGHQVDTILI